MRNQVLQVLDLMRLPQGLYVASLSRQYRYVWIRDTCYAALSELDADNGRLEQTVQAMLDILHPYRWKIQLHTQQKPKAEFEYIHPRYSADTFKELVEPWGNAQNDAIGLLLYVIGEGLRRQKSMLRNEADRQLVQLIVDYLLALEYWQDADNGVWEENREIHASSIGACVAGLLAISPYARVDWQAIQRGMVALWTLLPRESASKSCDLAQLSLIYPYRLLPREISIQLITTVETQLLRDWGVIRYHGDRYFAEGHREAEWCLGLSWLGLCHFTMGNEQKAREYLIRTERVMPHQGVIPELYLGQSLQPNENTPLAWAQSMYIQLYDATQGKSSAHTC
ncbi:MAG: hypothetical protein A2201_00645 [Alicyclobacillus sp. RIFOXYA1_FULL_53_8]|nr:MAG: hypothetical protein A2201_00645 [Alicyclobacillus sp. RIFOXYA1_FULL_53_8]